ncbi:PrgI family protein [Caproiciproducens faecalis]|uniref:PrgI family protein n=1 Tax=Caproiciproducens faecalis TaxID=2820301 RepID=A0ABS7DKK7_9FIRM|nr:PrgI family protein [Caproiciproducens faecalis]MBW7571839.1 PrgI family protein [Caproiciproducens faecalis]
MAYVPVPKDLTAVKTKVLFNLTKRQLICFGGGALIGVPLFFLLKGPAGLSAGGASLCMVLVMLPFFLTAVYEKNGLPMEKIVRNIARVLLLRPKQRPYQTNNFYAVLARQSKLDKEVRRIVSKKAKTGRRTVVVPRREASDRSRRRKGAANR